MDLQMNDSKDEIKVEDVESYNGKLTSDYFWSH